MKPEQCPPQALTCGVAKARPATTSPTPSHTSLTNRHTVQLIFIGTNLPFCKITDSLSQVKLSINTQIVFPDLERSPYGLLFLPVLRFVGPASNVPRLTRIKDKPFAIIDFKVEREFPSYQRRLTA
jgi:hypothetical protein